MIKMVLSFTLWSPGEEEVRGGGGVELGFRERTHAVHNNGCSIC